MQWPQPIACATSLASPASALLLACAAASASAPTKILQRCLAKGSLNQLSGDPRVTALLFVREVNLHRRRILFLFKNIASTIWWKSDSPAPFLRSLCVLRDLSAPSAVKSFRAKIKKLTLS